ncbi:cysteine synthase A [Nocardioidaceae bacterium]|nr:cysteine synthase A [Nocardioidaceae bacterium]
MKFDSILETIGDTPHVKLSRLFGDRVDVWLKLERQNPGGSIKDRIGLAMIEAAEADGRLKPGGEIVEPTSGNTGIGLAMASAVKGYPITLVMPESMSIERRKLMAAYGAKLELTPKEEGMKGAIAKAEQLIAERDGAWMPQQFENPANVEVHKRTTAKEIAADFPDGIDYMITGVGTGGHITGASEALKESFPDLKTYAVEPAKSPVISGGDPGPHKLQGIGAGFVPANLHTDTLDGTIQVSEEDAFGYVQRLARTEGILVGPSSGATLAAVAQKLPDLEDGATVLAFCYDTGERYLSIEGLFDAAGAEG